MYPGKNWEKYVNPEDAGWSSTKLDRAYRFYQKIGSSALMVIYNGIVLVSWGEVERRFLCHSMRKAFMNTLIGIYEAKGKIKLNSTLRELNINDVPSLTESEKDAKVIDLLKSKSGVYLTAQYEDPHTIKPKRCSFKPGEKHFYNNWDFNALLTIFENETDKKFFKEFARQVARPLQMEEFRVTDGYYHLEKGKSVHPAYPLRMSAKDLARFGHLYLKNGRWKNKQIISKSWINKSVKPYDFDGSNTGAFGLLWFVSNDKFQKLGMYSTLGNGGQSVSVVPKYKLVFVHRVNTYKWKSVSEKDRLKLLELILKAKKGKHVRKPKLKTMEENRTTKYHKIDPQSLKILPGLYKYKNNFWKIKRIGSKLSLISQYGDEYMMLPDGINSFVLEDSLRKVIVKNSRGKEKSKIVIRMHGEPNVILNPVI